MQFYSDKKEKNDHLWLNLKIGIDYKVRKKHLEVMRLFFAVIVAGAL
jgi:hypothetical protein